MKLKTTILILAACVLVLLQLCDAHDRQKRSPQKYDDYYDKFITRHFADLSGKYLDGKEEYKNASNDEEEENESGEEKSYEEDDEGDAKSDVQDHSFNYRNDNDYERIKALSEKQVAELHKKPENCKHFEKDGMICSECKDPETGDTSESCTYSSEPNDKKLAYTSRKNHNYKAPQVEASEDVGDDDEEESEDEEEKAVNSAQSDSKPLKQHKSEQEDANEYGAYRLAGDTADIDDEEPKFAHYKSNSGPRSEKLIELLPTQSYDSKNNKFQGRNLNQALTDFKTKDWSNCKKVLKGELTCYYCTDARGATQEECMFVSSTNPKNIKVERHESQKYDSDSKKPFSTVPTIISTTIGRSLPLKIAPIIPNKQESFARLRMARPLMPTKATKAETAEPLVTPKSSFELHFGEDLNPTVSSYKKTIKRTILNKKKKVTDFIPLESRVVAFESHVNHDE